MLDASPKRPRFENVEETTPNSPVEQSSQRQKFLEITKESRQRNWDGRKRPQSSCRFNLADDTTQVRREMAERSVKKRRHYGLAPKGQRGLTFRQLPLEAAFTCPLLIYLFKIQMEVRPFAVLQYMS